MKMSSTWDPVRIETPTDDAIRAPCLSRETMLLQVPDLHAVSDQDSAIGIGQRNAVSDFAPQGPVLAEDIFELSGEIMAEYCLPLSNEGKC